MGTRYFTSDTFGFLRDLAANNDRRWFDAHRDDYENHVREPALDFITDFAGPLGKISPRFTADARKAGGSLYRIHRDTRFAADKTPFKTNTGMHFRHEAGRDAHAPGFYLHIQPDECFAGAGLWRPETSAAYAVRTRIAEQPAEWRRAAHGKRFSDVFSLDGDSLVRPPKGFDADHPLIEDLKRKDFVGVARLTEEQVTSDRLLADFTDACRRATPFVRFLCEAAGVPF